MLIRAGANEDYLRHGGIFVTQQGAGSIGCKVFFESTNAPNEYTLFDLIATVYSDGGKYGAIPFPDFAHVMINRLKADGAKEEIPVNLDSIFQSGDCAKNLRLEWGDVILIPQLDHQNNVSGGLTQLERNTLGKCLLRKVTFIVNGQRAQFALVPSVVQSYGIFFNNSWSWTRPGVLPSVWEGEKAIYSFDLTTVVHQANVLMISSDLSRVKVTRRESEAGGQPHVLELNLDAQPPPKVTLQDGDIIEIPERNQK